MPSYLQRPRSATQILEGKQGVKVVNYVELMSVLPTIVLGEQVLRINAPVLTENFYKRGDQDPYNTFNKHAPSVMLPRFRSQEERMMMAVPFYVQRRNAYRRLRQERREKGDTSLLYYAGLSWKPEGKRDTTTRVMPLVAAFEGLEGYLVHHNNSDPMQRTDVTYEYDPHQAKTQGAKVLFGVPSRSARGKYRKELSAIHSFPVIDNPHMFPIASRMKSTHNCGYKENLRLRFEEVDGTQEVEPFCQHDVEGILAAIALSQQKLRKGEQVDKIYDRLEKKWASIPMYMNVVPLATPTELHDFRVLARNATIRRPKRDRSRGGFLRDTRGHIIYDKERPLWEAEIEAIMWTRIADLGRDSMFIRQRVVDLPPLE